MCSSLPHPWGLCPTDPSPKHVARHQPFLQVPAARFDWFVSATILGALDVPSLHRQPNIAFNGSLRVAALPSVSTCFIRKKTAYNTAHLQNGDSRALNNPGGLGRDCEQTSNTRCLAHGAVHEQRNTGVPNKCGHRAHHHCHLVIIIIINFRYCIHVRSHHDGNQACLGRTT